MIHDPRHLLHLTTLVDSSSFAEAAEKLSTSQPALSRTISYMESRLGAKLFDRSRKPAAPTALAQELAIIGRQIQSSMNSVDQVSKSFLSGRTGRVRLGAPPFMCDSWLGQILSEFLSTNPGIDLVLTPGYVSDLRLGLLENHLDISIAPQELIEEKALRQVAKLGSFDHQLVCRRDHPLTQLDKITPADLEAVRWVSHQRQSVLHAMMKTSLHDFGVQRIDIAFESGSSNTLLSVIKNSDFLSLWPVYDPESWFEAHELQCIALSQQQPHLAFHQSTTAFHIIAHEHRPPTFACERVVNFLCHAFS